MIVCHCHAVSDREIRSAIDQGVRDLEELGAACQAGTRCGGCRPGICELLDEPEQVLALPVAS